MPDAPRLDEVTLTHLGQGALDYFDALYPFLTLSLSQRMAAIVRHYGGQAAAARTLGISPRQLRRWLAGTATPKPANRANADREYLSIHLRANGFTPSNAVERRLSDAWSKGAGPKTLGRILGDILIKDNAVPATLAITGPVSFEPGMSRMWAPTAEISTGDNRGHFPFNIGTYTA